MAVSKLSEIASGGATAGATDKSVVVRSGTTDLLVTPVALDAIQTWTAAQTFVGPVLGVASATSINKIAITAPATGATLTIADGATLTASASATVSGTNTGNQTTSNSDSTITVATGTTNPVISLNLANPNTWTAAQTVKITDAATATVTNCIIVSHASSGTAAASFGTGIKFQGQSSTTADQDMALIASVWTTATHASRSSQIQFQTVSNAGALSTGLVVGSGISGGSAGLIAGGVNSTLSAIWSNLVTPATNNYAFACNSTQSFLNAPSGGSAFIAVSGSAVVTVTASTYIIPKVTTYAAVATAGLGLPAIYGSANITAQSSNATICSYTNAATDGDFEVSAAMNVTAATGISTSLVVTYTDVANNAQTLILPVQASGGTGGTYLASGLVIATGDYSTPVHHIRVKASTVITVKTAAGTFTGVTYSASGKIKQTNSGNT